MYGFQFSSVAQLCPTLCDPMNHSMPGLPVHHQLPESTQAYVHWVGDDIQPSHPLSSPSPPALNLSQHQGLFKMSQLFVSGGQSIGVSASTSVLPMNTQDWSPLGWTGWISLQSKGLYCCGSWLSILSTYYTWLLSLELIMFWRLGLRRTSCWRIFYEILAWSSASSRMYQDCVIEAIPWPRWHLQSWFISCQAAYWGQRMSPDYHQSSLCLDVLGFPRKESWQIWASWHLTSY